MCRHHVGVGGQASLVAVHHLLLDARGGVGADTGVFDLLGQAQQRGEFVFHLFHGGQRRLPIAGGGGVVSGQGLIDRGGACAAVKHVLRQRHAQRPQQFGCRNHVQQVAAAGADAALQRELRKVGAARHADARIGGGHGALGGGHVGPAQQQFRRHAGRHGGHAVDPRRRRQAEVGRRLTHQQRNGVLVQLAVHLQRHAAGARAFQRALRLQHVGARGHASVVAVLRDLHAAFVAGDDVVQQRHLGVLLAQRKVGGGEAPLGRQARRRQVGFAHLHVGALRAHRVADLAPQIGRPADVEADRAGMRGAPVLPAGALRAHRRADVRQQASALLAQQRLGLRHVGGGQGQVLVVDVHALHQRRQLGVGKQLPPAAGLPGARVVGADPAGLRCGGLPRGRQRHDGRLLARRKAAAAQRHQQCRCGNGFE